MLPPLLLITFNGECGHMRGRDYDWHREVLANKESNMNTAQARARVERRRNPEPDGRLAMMMAGILILAAVIFLL